MKHLSSILRLTGTALLTTGIFFALLLVGLCTRKGSDRRRRVRFSIMRTWGRGMLKLCHIDLTVEGSPPAPPFLLVCNHLSYVDIIVLASVVNGRFVAKADIAHWPLIGQATGSAGTLFINRENRKDLLRVGKLLEDAYTDGDGIILFAEGTSSNGDGILILKPSLLQHAAQTGYPVHYAVLSYEVPGNPAQARDEICWWTSISMVPHLQRMLYIPRIQARLHLGEHPITHPDRKQLATQLRQAMLDEFTPIAPPGTT